MNDMKQLRFQRPCNGHWPIEELPKGWKYHTEEPTIELLESGLKLFRKQINNYDGMWNIDDYFWRVENGRKFHYITKDDKIISFVWQSPGGKVKKSWNKTGSPVYDTPSFFKSNDVETMNVGKDNSYSYNTWICDEYRGLGKHMNLRSFREMEKLGKKSIIHDVEMWNKSTIIHCIKYLESDIIDLLEK